MGTAGYVGIDVVSYSAGFSHEVVASNANLAVAVLLLVMLALLAHYS
jgi:hypothetical protein